MKALVGAFNQEKARVGAFSVIVQLHWWIDLQHYSCYYAIILFVYSACWLFESEFKTSFAQQCTSPGTHFWCEKLNESNNNRPELCSRCHYSSDNWLDLQNTVLQLLIWYENIELNTNLNLQILGVVHILRGLFWCRARIMWTVEPEMKVHPKFRNHGEGPY